MAITLDPLNPSLGGDGSESVLLTSTPSDWCDCKGVPRWSEVGAGMWEGVG